MEIITRAELVEWCRIDPQADDLTLSMLTESAVDVVGHETGIDLRTADTVPDSLRHAVAVHVAAHFDSRAGSVEAAMLTVKRLCAPHVVPRL